jgi:hypothetical protein
VWPTCSEAESIDTDTLAGTDDEAGAVIFTVVVSNNAPTVARMTAVPCATAVTTPVELTLASSGASELHVIVCPDITAPF